MILELELNKHESGLHNTLKLRVDDLVFFY